MPEIEVASLVKQFGDQRALDDVSFTVADGELFTLLGPSGCGKSTTLMSIAGFQTPGRGPDRVGGDASSTRRAALTSPAERRNLGIVFQSYAVWPHMTVFDNLAFPLKVRKLERTAIRHAGERGARARRPRAVRDTLSAPALRRAATAGRARPRARLLAVRAPARRAVLEPRREAARARARLGEGAAVTRSA